MKYIKFEKIVEGKNPILRITYKNWLGKIKERDICKPYTMWRWMDNSSAVKNDAVIEAFFNSEYKVYQVNGKGNTTH